MNYIWVGLFIISFIFGAKNGCIDEVTAAGLSGAASAATMLLSFGGMMCFWSGFLAICEKSGAAEFCEKLLSPAIRRLFPNVSSRKSITMNIVTNLLGMGNAATPAGLDAMQQLDEENGGFHHPSREMCRFVVMNTASLQVFPTTIISLLSAGGAKNPFAAVPLIWICSLASLFAALSAEALLPMPKKRRTR